MEPDTELDIFKRVVDAFEKEIREDWLRNYQPVCVKPKSGRFSYEDFNRMRGAGLTNTRYLPVSHEIIGYVPKENVNELLSDPAVSGVEDMSGHFETCAAEA